MIKFYLTITTILLFSTAVISQETKPFKLSFNGYVRADALFDTRQVVEAREGFLLFYPKKPVFDKEGNDINAQPAFNQYAMTTRLSFKVEGPSVLGATSYAFAEGDFTGASNAENNSLRLRHAYINLQWKNTRLLAGQYWHPLDLPEMIPNVLGLNTGAPFHSFSRQPQIRLERRFNKLNAVAVVASQRDYVNSGPIGNSYTYLRNSPLPNLHGQLQYKATGFFAGAGIDYKLLKPRLVTDSNFISNELVNCLSYTAFLKFDAGKLNIKTQYVFNQALNDHLMMGGFGVTEINPDNDRRSYKPLQYHAAWLNLSYNAGKWQPSLFTGYSSRIDDNDVLLLIYARDPDIRYVYRVAPMITFTERKFNFMFELEYTAVSWDNDETSLILYKNKETGNLRVGLGAVYNFSF